MRAENAGKVSLLAQATSNHGPVPVHHKLVLVKHLRVVDGIEVVGEAVHSGGTGSLFMEQHQPWFTAAEPAALVQSRCRPFNRILRPLSVVQWQEMDGLSRTASSIFARIEEDLQMHVQW